MPKQQAAANVLGEESFDRSSALRLGDYNYKVSDKDWVTMQQLNGTGDYSRPDPLKPGPAPSVNVDGVEAVNLTKAAYEALSDEQRSAVDFNTLLVRAREKDLTKDYEFDDAETETYNQSVRDMFGDKSGSYTFAPNTVKLLNEFGFKDEAQDLDQFLSLERAVDSTKLKDFSIEKRRSGVELIDPTVAAIEKAGKVIAEAKASGGGELLTALRSGVSGEPPIGWGNSADRTDTDAQLEEEFFQSMYGGIARGGTLEDLQLNMREREFTQEDADKLWRFFDDYTKYEASAGLDVGDGEERRTAAEIRRVLGLED